MLAQEFECSFEGGSSLTYFDELKRAMNYLGMDSRVIVLGQAVSVPGTAMTNTLTEVPSEKLIELPVAEELQMGMSIGLALDGWIPVSIYPRWNFVLLAMNQLVNHLDKITQISNGGYTSQVIIRTSISISYFTFRWQRECKAHQSPVHKRCSHFNPMGHRKAIEIC